MTDIIEGVVISIMFSNAENGYTVLRLDTAEGAVAATGTMPGISVGEKLQMTGAWITHPQYGEQFKVETFEIKPPTETHEVFDYLASGSIKHIGPGRARDIADKFGAEALSIIENCPDRLAEIKGISLRTARKIGDDYRQSATLRRLISFLRDYGIRPLIAARLYKDYGADALQAVHDNPYLIAAQPYGAAFFEADFIAQSLGFDSDSDERISAALTFTLTHNLTNGHTFIPKDKLTAAVSELIGINGGRILETLHTLGQRGDIVIEAIAGVEACYLEHIYNAESYVASRLSAQRDGSAADSTPLCFKNLYPKASGAQSITYSKKQLEAITLAAGHKALILTGGPGTGKTTTVRGILEFFDNAGLKTYLCAPTGRAAKRLSELCLRDASTIHRLLGATLDEAAVPIFERDESNPLEADAIIVDETSMIDILLMEALLRAVPQSCKIIMVGDADQLPSIGPGCLLTDIIRSEAVPVVRLTEIFRQAEDSGIVRGAHSVNRGIMPDIKEKYPDLFFIWRKTEEDLARTIAELYAERLPQKMNIDPVQIQVLSPTRKRAAGTVALNELLREKLNPRAVGKGEKKVGDTLFRVGDKVMQIKNNYDILWVNRAGQSDGSGVLNGDVGTIAEIDPDKETLTVDFDDKTVIYTFDRLSELEPAFAVTVHKSQGSEYHTVILAMTAAAPVLLTRSVLYTAMTRAKSLLIVVGSMDVMSKMVQNDKRQKRYSGLRARLANSLEE
ncbi:MAG: ATP-dependent RecD-like DNA helicase [Oscillospiraceae bacterium]|nr:ATP-dependent RecD-like DNA helicase [Oscillospiraceae bacterium]